MLQVVCLRFLHQAACHQTSAFLLLNSHPRKEWAGLVPLAQVDLARRPGSAVVTSGGKSLEVGTNGIITALQKLVGRFRVGTF